jgi:hypothetical protein
VTCSEAVPRAASTRCCVALTFPLDGHRDAQVAPRALGDEDEHLQRAALAGQVAHVGHDVHGAVRRHHGGGVGHHGQSPSTGRERHLEQLHRVRVEVVEGHPQLHVGSGRGYEVGRAPRPAVGLGGSGVLAHERHDAVGEEELRPGGALAPPPAPGDEQDQEEQQAGEHQVDVPAPRRRVEAHAGQRLHADLVEAPQCLQ